MGAIYKKISSDGKKRPTLSWEYKLDARLHYIVICDSILLLFDSIVFRTASTANMLCKSIVRTKICTQEFKKQVLPRFVNPVYPFSK